MLRAIATELLDLFAPPRCVACDEPCARGPSFCPRCLAQLERCPHDPSRASTVFAAYVQDGPLVRAVHRAKFGSDLAPCRAMGRLLAEALGPRLEEVDVVVPIALHRARLVERGFNQAAEIAKALRKPVAYDALARVKRTRAQATLSREDRRDNVRDAFVLARPRAIEGKRALLVDDVVTTGATMEAARVALEAGAPRSILCAAVARAVLWADRR